MNNNNSETTCGGNGKSSAYLSPLAVIALSFGYAVGWGAFVLPGTTFLPNAGPIGTLLGILIGATAICVLAYNFHRMSLHMQAPGGTYGFVTNLFGHDHGFLVAWFLFLTYVAILWANATALVLLTRYLFGETFQFGFHYTMVGFDVYFGEVLLSLAAIILCGCACLYSKRLAIRLHTFFAGVLFFGVLACFAAAFLKHKGGLAAMGPAFSADGPTPVQVLRILAMAPWAFVGFEAVVHSSSEFRFPVKRLFSLLLTAVFISTLVYLLLALLPLLALPENYSTWPKYIAALPQLKGIHAMPVFSAARQALGPLGIAIIGAAMLSGQLTAIFATFIAVSRLIRSMAENHTVPAWFGKCNDEGTPSNAILFVMCISLPIPFLGRTVIGWPVDISNLGAALAYAYTSAAAYALSRQDNTPGHFWSRFAGISGIAISIVFTLLMIVPNYLSGNSLSTESYLLLAIWCIGGFILYRRAFRKDRHDQFGHSTVVWVSVLIVIFASSLMWFRMAVCDSAEQAFGGLVGRRISHEAIAFRLAHVSIDMQVKSIVELCLLLSSLGIMLNLFSILRKRERNLIVEKLKAEESANKSKSYFFSTVSHDIRTPLNAIIGFSQMLKMGFKTEAEREQALESILSSGKTLLHLINDALDFSKLEDGRLEIVPAPTDCPALLNDIIESCRSANKNPDVEYRNRIGEMPALMVDAKRIRQVLFNLLDNAAKFTHAGFVELRSSFEKQPEGDTGTLRIEVEDTGCGIGKEDLKRITSPYVQVEAKQARHGGTGLGLTVCQQMAYAMGGDLAIESELGKGSTFTLILPNVKTTILEKKAEATPEEKPAETNLKQHQDSNTPRRILIVDDQKMNLMVLKAMLKKLGSFDIVMATNGQEALDILNASADAPIDCILTDMWMPTMDGEGLVKAIRADGKLASLPVYVVTADVEMQGKDKELGFDGILLKPVTVEKIKSLIG